MVIIFIGILFIINEIVIGDDGDEVFVEVEFEGISLEVGLEIDS